MKYLTEPLDKTFVLYDFDAADVSRQDKTRQDKTIVILQNAK